MLFGPFFSTVVQYVSYRWLIVNAQFIGCVINGIFWVLAMLDGLALWHLVIGSLCIGFGSAYDWSSRRALIPDLVGKDRTTDAMVLETVPQNVSRLLGPLMSGILLEFAGIKGGFLALFILCVLQVIVIIRLSGATDRKDRKKSRLAPRKDLILAFRYARRNPRISGVLVITFLMNAFAFSYQVLLPVFVRDILSLGPLELGILGAGVGIGSILGIALINGLGQYYRDGLVFTVSSLLNALATLVFALSSSFSLSLVMLILVGLGQAGFSVMQSSIILRAASDAMRARVMGLLALAIGGGPPGRLIVGSLTGLVGAPLALSLCAGVASVGIAGIIWRLSGLRRG